MMVSHLIRLLYILEELEKRGTTTGSPILPSQSYKLNNDFIISNYPLTNNRVLNPSKLPLFYDEPVISEENDTYNAEAYFNSASDGIDGLADILGKEDSYLVKNNGAKMRDYINECLKAYNLCGRYRDENDRIFEFEYTYTVRTVKYSNDIPISDNSSEIIDVHIGTLEGLLNFRDVYTSLSYFSSLTRNELVIRSLDLVIKEWDNDGVFQHGHDFLDQFKIMVNYYELNFPDTGAVFENRTFNNVLSTVDYVTGESDSIIFIMDEPENTPSVDNRTFSNRMKSDALLMRYQELEISDLITYDPAPSTWL